ncbi:MAG: FtsX-like permease family protein [Acidobacteria bacterium]|nr:FtsX-like permease family protein [Acidobacteriota bacterium]
MRPSRLVIRGLVYYWRTNAAVVLGVATAVAVLAGALLVGDSVRGSLRDLVLQRLGRTDRLVLSSRFFREALADDLRADAAFASSFDGICPVIVVQGVVSDETSGRRASRVQVYGVDDRFWRFHRVAGRRGPEGRDALLSRTLASEIGARPGRSVLVRVERPSAIPGDSLHGRKEDRGRTLRLTVRGIAGPADLGDFSLRPQQGNVRAVFVPLNRLQQDLDVAGRVNALLVSDRPLSGSGTLAGRLAGLGATPDLDHGLLAGIVQRRAALDDLGLTVRVVGADREPREGDRSSTATRGVLAVESSTGLLDEARATAADEAAAGTAMKTQPVLTYLANTLRSRDRQVPYSLVTATDLRSIVPLVAPDSSSVPPPIVLNEWAARDLDVKAGDPLTLEYYVWEEPGRLLARSADVRIAAVVPIEGAAADRDLAPVYPGITEAESLGDWDPPFPIDFGRVRRTDEDYWTKYRTTPKAFIPLQVGQALWRSRYGDRTSVRIVTEPGQSLTEARERYAMRLRAKVDPLDMGLSVHDVRAEGLAASRGATDFGEYFTYFSFFLVVSALLLAALFFRLGVEQRAREVGLLRSVGLTTAAVRRLFAGEGLLLALIGSVLGVAGAVVYGAIMMAGLRTWWSGAVGTRALSLHVSPASLMTGAAGAAAAAMACIWWTLRGLARLSERSLLAGQLAGDAPAGRQGASSRASGPWWKSGVAPRWVRRRRPNGVPGAAAALAAPNAAGLAPRAAQMALFAAIGFAAVGSVLMAATVPGMIGQAGAFFGAGAALLVACLCLLAFRLRQPARRSLEGHGWRPVARLGLRNAADRPGRSVLAVAAIASATFILISVDAFRREGPAATDRHSGVGGYPLLVELLLPVVHDPNGRDGREMLGLGGLGELTIEPFRVLPGDDASCLNLYEPRNPRILGASRTFIESGRFSFHSSLASSEAERANPWLLLNRDTGGDSVPVIADANSMTYVLHKKLGDDIVVNRGARPVRLRLVAALADSIFQGELLMSDASFVKLFPERVGYQYLLVEAPAGRAAQVAAAIEYGAADLGADAVPTTERLAEFHTVENTYLSTFQTLGGLGLLVGTVGVAAVLLRNVLERRRELALLGAVGYRRAHIFAIVVAENVLLLGWGLAIGTLCALVAIAPAAVDRGGRLPVVAGGWLLLLAVFVAGLLSSAVATRAALRAPLIGALRAE